MQLLTGDLLGDHGGGKAHTKPRLDSERSGTDNGKTKVV